mmetsp:Transcript_23164/g.42006  ORF Transcript_23164/g.42006 Transcript_23164/m.42006 type:complete len:85 (+) Transcript_23164:147-401(+)
MASSESPMDQCYPSSLTQDSHFLMTNVTLNQELSISLAITYYSGSGCNDISGNHQTSRRSHDKTLLLSCWHIRHNHNSRYCWNK